MILCPYCGAENTEGADQCDGCQHSLTDVNQRTPVNPIERGLLRDRIETLKPKRPLTVGAQEPIGDVLQKMVAESIGCVMVAEGDELLGIFSERDALLKVNVDAPELRGRAIGSVMTPNPSTLRAKDKIAFALHRMDVGGYRHIPILDDDDRLTGVISIRDILDYLTAQRAAESSEGAVAGD